MILVIFFAFDSIIAPENSLIYNFSPIIYEVIDVMSED